MIPINEVISSHNILNTSNLDNISTYDSNIHKKLEETHKI